MPLTGEAANAPSTEGRGVMALSPFAQILAAYLMHRRQITAPMRQFASTTSAKNARISRSRRAELALVEDEEERRILPKVCCHISSPHRGRNPIPAATPWTMAPR